MLRYVGWSSNRMGRPNQKHSAHCRNWEISLDKAGVKKQVAVIQAFPELTNAEDEEINVAMRIIESGWIANFKKLGFPLTNITLGGEGAVGRKLSAETRQRMSQ